MKLYHYLNCLHFILKDDRKGIILRLIQLMTSLRRDSEFLTSSEGNITHKVVSTTNTRYHLVTHIMRVIIMKIELPHYSASSASQTCALALLLFAQKIILLWQPWWTLVKHWRSKRQLLRFNWETYNKILCDTSWQLVRDHQSEIYIRATEDVKTSREINAEWRAQRWGLLET